MLQCCVARGRPTGDRQRPSAQPLNWADGRSANDFIIVMAVAQCTILTGHSGCERGEWQRKTLKMLVCGPVVWIGVFDNTLNSTCPQAPSTPVTAHVAATTVVPRPFFAEGIEDRGSHIEYVAVGTFGD